MELDLKAVFAHFDIMSKYLDYQTIDEGHINFTFRIMAEENGQTVSYILQRINPHVFKKPIAIMQNIAVVAAHLKQVSYPRIILEAIPTKGGKDYHIDPAGYPWRLFPFIKNTTSFYQTTDPTIAFQAGQAIGEYLFYLSSLAAENLQIIIPDFHNTSLRLQTFKQYLAADEKGRVKYAKSAIDSILSYRNLVTEFAALKLPLRATHNDTKLNNILFDSKGEFPVCVIDLDTLMPGSILSDYGDMIRTMAATALEDEANMDLVKISKPVFKAATKGFLSSLEKVLTPVEKDNLLLGAKIIILEQAIRFLTDFLAGDVYYSTTYPDHNLVRANNQLALLADLIRQEKDLV